MKLDLKTIIFTIAMLLLIIGMSVVAINTTKLLDGKSDISKSVDKIADNSDSIVENTKNINMINSDILAEAKLTKGQLINAADFLEKILNAVSTPRVKTQVVYKYKRSTPKKYKSTKKETGLKSHNIDVESIIKRANDRILNNDTPPDLGPTVSDVLDMEEDTRISLDATNSIKPYSNMGSSSVIEKIKEIERETEGVKVTSAKNSIKIKEHKKELEELKIKQEADTEMLKDMIYINTMGYDEDDEIYKYEIDKEFAKEIRDERKQDFKDFKEIEKMLNEEEEEDEYEEEDSNDEYEEDLSDFVE